MIHIEESKQLNKLRIKDSFEKATNDSIITLNGIEYNFVGGLDTYLSFTLAYNSAEYRNESEVSFRTADNIIHTLPIDQFKNIISELACFGNDSWIKKVTLQTKIDNCGSVGEMESIVW